MAPKILVGLCVLLSIQLCSASVLEGSNSKSVRFLTEYEEANATARSLTCNPSWIKPEGETICRYQKHVVSGHLWKTSYVHWTLQESAHTFSECAARAKLRGSNMFFFDEGECQTTFDCFPDEIQPCPPGEDAKMIYRREFINPDVCPKGYTRIPLGCALISDHKMLVEFAEDFCHLKKGGLFASVDSDIKLKVLLSQIMDVPNYDTYPMIDLHKTDGTYKFNCSKHEVPKNSYFWAKDHPKPDSNWGTIKCPSPEDWSAPDSRSDSEACHLGSTPGVVPHPVVCLIKDVNYKFELGPDH